MVQQTNVGFRVTCHPHQRHSEHQSTLTSLKILVQSSYTEQAVCMSASRQVSLMRPHVNNNHNIGNINGSFIECVHVIMFGLKK